jgi:hypothetical protein
VHLAKRGSSLVVAAPAKCATKSSGCCALFLFESAAIGRARFEIVRPELPSCSYGLLFRSAWHCELSRGIVPRCPSGAATLHCV